MKLKRVRGKKVPVRIPLPQKTGGAHRDNTQYNRQRDRKRVIQDWAKSLRDAE